MDLSLYNIGLDIKGSDPFSSSGKVVHYTYDTVSGKLSGMDVNGQSLVSNMVFSPLGVLSSQTLGNGLLETRVADGRGRVTSISSPALARSLVWSADSMISSINDSLDPYANQIFTYDLSGRLTQATGTYGNITYSYDANGNRMSRSDAVGISNYVYTAGSNRLQSVAGSNYALDAAGNTTRFDVKRMRYSVNNRMTGYKDASTGIVTNYYHNGLGERVAKKVAGQLTLYMYDLSGNLIVEYNKTARKLSEYVYGASGRLATLSKNQVYWHHNDHLGTPQALTNINGTVVWTMSQTPFGISTVNEDPDGDGITVTNNFRFPSQYYDSETGLNYNYQRTYDPTIGRYTQHDPIGLNGGMNPFGYVGGNPVGLFDLFGLFTSPIDNPQYRGWYRSGWYPEWSKFGKISGRTAGVHQGVDLYAPVGTPVKASICGEIVERSGWGAFGYHIIIKGKLSGRTVYLQYAHLSSMKVTKGQTVSEGDIIGYSGQSGNARSLTSRQTHLHFEVRKQIAPTGGLATRYDPANYFSIGSGNKSNQK